MSTYVISDIHGEYELFIQLLDKIRLKDSDTLYILGDVLDRGPHPVKTLLKLMEMPNAICMVGNHEFMALECLNIFMQEVTDDFLEKLDIKEFENYLEWLENGGQTTIDELCALDIATRKEIQEFLGELLVYEEIIVAGRDYVLVHAGIANFSPDTGLDEYGIHELVWSRPDYSIPYYEDRYVITGHTPTQLIKGNEKPGYIYKNKNHIAIDCGSYRPDGRLAAICLDTWEEFYAEKN